MCINSYLLSQRNFTSLKPFNKVSKLVNVKCVGSKHGFVLSKDERT